MLCRVLRYESRALGKWAHRISGEGADVDAAIVRVYLSLCVYDSLSELCISG